VARFHPGEKAAQWLVDVLPFVLLGVAGEPLALVFVFYAVHGFAQHANWSVRLGWFNWLVAGPELHRWYHAIDAPDGGVNFGNNLIVWDILFGTRFLPAGSNVTGSG